MSFPNKEIRQRCWDSRDRYWECLDANENDAEQNCQNLRKSFESNCPAQWVKHFDRKKQYLVFKNKIENEGYEPISNLKS